MSLFILLKLSGETISREGGTAVRNLRLSDSFMEDQMRQIGLAAAAALWILPGLAHAQDAAAGAATGAAVGAGVGAVVGGPVGAAVGAGVGGTVGAGAADNGRVREDRVIVEERAPAVRERNCVTNASGTTLCEEISR